MDDVISRVRNTRQNSRPRPVFGNELEEPEEPEEVYAKEPEEEEKPKRRKAVTAKAISKASAKTYASAHIKVRQWFGGLQQRMYAAVDDANDIEGAWLFLLILLFILPPSIAAYWYLDNQLQVQTYMNMFGVPYYGALTLVVLLDAVQNWGMMTMRRSSLGFGLWTATTVWNLYILMSFMPTVLPNIQGSATILIVSVIVAIVPQYIFTTAGYCVRILWPKFWAGLGMVYDLFRNIPSYFQEGQKRAPVDPYKRCVIIDMEEKV